MKDVPHTSNGWITAALVTAGLLGVAHVAYKANIVQILYGQGYLPWVKLEWKAKQAASRHGKPLLMFVIDPRHADNRHLEKLARAPEVERLIDRFVWHKAERTAEGDEPAPPLLVPYGSSGETPIMESVPVDAGVTPAALAERLGAALEAFEVDAGS